MIENFIIFHNYTYKYHTIEFKTKYMWKKRFLENEK